MIEEISIPRDVHHGKSMEFGEYGIQNNIHGDFP